MNDRAPTPHPSLRQPASNLIGGQWLPLGGMSVASGGMPVVASTRRGGLGHADRVISHNPAHPSRVIWSGAPAAAHVDQAVAAAREALPAWSRWPRERRFGVLRRLKALYERDAQRIADLICDETGKVMWDARSEAGALASKVDITLDSSEPAGPLRRVSDFEIGLGGTRRGRCWFRPHGVMAVLAPFNFPAHLANGHIVPALAMGNTIILKPSDKTPGVGQLLAELIQEALEAEGAPRGVMNLVQGGADIAAPLTRHAGVDGILFTGSFPVGRRILEANLDNPGRIVALEMGGNNAAVVLPDADLKQAAIECVRSAFVTTGQRCTCTRRLIVHKEIATRLIPAIQKAASNLIVGDPRAEHPVFMGPMIRKEARDAVLAFQADAARHDGRMLLESTPLSAEAWFITPGILEVDRFLSGPPDAEAEGRGPQSRSFAIAGPDSATEASGTTTVGARSRGQLSGVSSPSRAPPPIQPGRDIEVFGPLLRLTVANSLEDAIEQANATHYGLAASIFTHDERAIERFFHEARAGCVNVNTGTAGASSKLPFGGLGRSGNHRPAGSFSLDYCAYPVAGMIETGSAATLHPGMRFDDAWLR